MKLETKYNLGDVVWFMQGSSVVSAKLRSVTLFVVGTDQDTIAYTAEKIHNPVSWLDYQYLHEVNLFPSKQELLDSL